MKWWRLYSILWRTIVCRLKKPINQWLYASRIDHVIWSKVEASIKTEKRKLYSMSENDAENWKEKKANEK